LKTFLLFLDKPSPLEDLRYGLLSFTSLNHPAQFVLFRFARNARLQIQPNLVSQLESRYGIPVRLIDQANIHALRN